MKKGDPLARIDVREQEAMVKRTEAALESAKSAQLQARVADNRARRELDRMRQLKEAGLATGRGSMMPGPRRRPRRRGSRRHTPRSAPRRRISARCGPALPRG